MGPGFPRGSLRRSAFVGIVAVAALALVASSLGAFGAAAASGTAPFKAAAPAPTCVAPGNKCALVFSHTSGFPSRLINLTGENYYPADHFSVYWWTGSGPTKLLASGPTNPLSGWFNISFRIPFTPNGTYSIFVNDFTGDNLSQVFYLGPHITATPDGGPIGGHSTIAGAGFSAMAAITFTMHNVKVKTTNPCKSNPLGTLKPGCAIDVPKLAAGTYQLIASDGTHTTSTRFIVT